MLRLISHHSFSLFKSDWKHVYFSLFLKYFICTYVVSVDVHTYKAGNKQWQTQTQHCFLAASLIN